MKKNKIVDEIVAHRFEFLIKKTRRLKKGDAFVVDFYSMELRDNFITPSKKKKLLIEDWKLDVGDCREMAFRLTAIVRWNRRVPTQKDIGIIWDSNIPVTIYNGNRPLLVKYKDKLLKYLRAKKK